jgi:hypothetical protein
MEQVERCLGFKPRFGALDAAFDAFYVYEYFHNSGGFAAVAKKANASLMRMVHHSATGRPMTLKYTFQCKTTLMHERFVCPLL